MPRPIYAEIDRGALVHNYRLAKRMASSSHVWAVLKANAYGHGLQNAASALADDADGFIVVDIEEALLLRESGFNAPILLIEGWFDAEDLATVARAGLSAVIHSPEQIDILEARSGLQGVGTKIPVYLKINSGMNRLGLRPAETAKQLARLRAHPAIGNITLMTHFAAADAATASDAPGTFERQLADFDRLCADLDWQGACSLANSAALLRFPHTHRQAVRPGIMLYGASPYADLQSAASLGLEPVMTVHSRIIAVQQLRPGEKVSYGGVFVADETMRIGIVACGYADGYPRHAPTGTPVLVDGCRTRLVGRVTMDMLMVDLTPCPGAGIDSPVTLWGEGLPVDEVAQSAGTIGYELLTALAPRVTVRCI